MSSIDTTPLAIALKHAIPCTIDGTIRPSLGGVRWEIANEVATLTATDGAVLIEATAPMPEGLTWRGTVGRAYCEALLPLLATDPTVGITADGGTLDLLFGFARISLYTSTVPYPDVQKIWARGVGAAGCGNDRVSALRSLATDERDGFVFTTIDRYTYDIRLVRRVLSGAHGREYVGVSIAPGGELLLNGITWRALVMPLTLPARAALEAIDA